MKKQLSLLLAISLLVGLFAVYTPAPVAAASGRSAYFFDYTNGYTQTTEGFESNTLGVHDPKEKALKITTAGKSVGDTGYDSIGVIRWSPPKNAGGSYQAVSIAQYPYFAVKIKVADDAVTESTVHYSARTGINTSFGAILKPLAGHDTYETGKWVLYICDGNSVLANAGYTDTAGRWLGNKFFVTQNTELVDGTVKDLAWIQWAGAFATVEDAQAYFDETTPVQANISGACDYFFDYSTSATITSGYTSSASSAYNSPEGNSTLKYDTTAHALKVSTKTGHNTNGNVGQVHFWPSAAVSGTVSTAEYPYFAVKIKMIKTDMVPPRSASARKTGGGYAAISSALQYEEKINPNQNYAYQAYNEDWQLMVFNASSQVSNAPYWTDIAVSLTDIDRNQDPNLYDGTAEDLAYIAWAGAFESLEKAQAYFDATTTSVQKTTIKKDTSGRFWNFSLPLTAYYYQPFSSSRFKVTGNAQYAFDPEQDAMKISTKDATTAGIGQMQWYSDSEVTNFVDLTQYPIYAIKIKVARQDLGGMMWQGATSNTDASARFATTRTTTLQYQNTDDWQLLTMDLTDATLFSGYTFANNTLGHVKISSLTTNEAILSEAENVDLAWIQWAGCFASVEDAQKYYNQTTNVVQPLESVNAAILGELDENGTQGLRFYHTLKTLKTSEGEVIQHEGETLKVRGVYVLMSTLKTLEGLGKTADDLTVELTNKSAKVKRISINSCRSRVETDKDVTYSFTALLTNIKQQNKQTDVCARAYLRCQREDGTFVNVYDAAKVTNVKEMYEVVRNSISDQEVHTWMTGRSAGVFLSINNEASLDKITKHSRTTYEYSPDSSSVLVKPAYNEAYEGGTIGFDATAAASVEQYPIFAMRVKLQNSESTFGRFYWRTEESERMNAFVSSKGGSMTEMQYIRGTEVTYEATSEWQIVYTDMSKVHNPLFNGSSWTKIMCNLLPYHGVGVTTADGVYIDWMGVFASPEEVFAYANEEWTPSEEETEEPLSDLEQNAKDNAWKINNNLPSEMEKLSIQEDDTFIINGYEEGETYSFQHHPSLVYFKGKWYAGYSNGVKDEDAPGQKMVYSTSEDFETWTAPVDLVVPGVESMYTHNTLDGMETFNEQGIITTQIIGNFSVVGDTLCFYYTVGEFTAASFDENGNFKGMETATQVNTRQYAIYSTDGVTWSTTPKKVTTLDSYSTFRQSPYGSNKWYSLSSFRIHYSDTKDIDPTQKITSSQLTGDQLKNSKARCPGSLTETSYYQSPDGALHLLCRSDTGYLWASTSTDEGQNWSEFYPTNFTSASTKFNFIHLPDGRIAWVGSPYYNVRSPLTLYISEDGYNFDKAYILQDEIYELQGPDGFSKDGGFAYPQLEVRDGYLYVMYTKQKEVVEGCRVALTDIP